MNEDDSEQLALQMERLGYTRAANPENADVVLLNTCSVRLKPEEKVYSKLGELRLLKMERPNMLIAVCGCMAQAEQVQIRRRAPYVDLLLGTNNVGRLAELLEQARSRGSGRRRAPVTALDLPPRRGATVTDVPARMTARSHQLRAFVPIMYGCDRFCTYCIVPQTRGRERSRPSDEIIEEIQVLAQSGTREVTLLGQTVNSYGKNLAEGRVPFARLLERIAKIDGIERIRFTSPHPRDFTDDLIETMARLPNVCHHVHLPLQVADDDLLAQMHRGYSSDEFRQILTALRTAIPGVAVSTDLMLGYPGETDAQFRNTLQFVEEVRFDAAYMFAYSPRPGTKAADLPNQIPQQVKVERLNTLIDLQNRITVEINQALVGEEAWVLVDGVSPRDPARLVGLTGTFKMVHFHGPRELIGSTVRVRLTEGHLTGFFADILS